MWPLIIGAAMGLAKSEMDRKQARKLQQAEAVKTEFSPWTGMQGETVQMPSSMGGAMQGAAMGAMYQQANKKKKEDDSTDWTSFMSGMSGR